MFNLNLLGQASGAAAMAVAASLLLLRAGALRLLQPAPRHDEVDQTVFLLDGARLLDACYRGRQFLSAAPRHGMTECGWLLTHLERMFPGLGAELAALGPGQSLERQGEDGMLMLAERHTSTTRIILMAQNGDMDRLTRQAEREELCHLRAAALAAPAPTWYETEDGAVIWANRAYLELAGRERPVWPFPRLFEPGGSGRIQCGTEWYDVHAEADDGGRHCFALPAGPAVRAEAQLRDFRQTLSRTFADLPIGLAVFDNKRKLQMFNPALLELTRLASGFLSDQPSLFAMLDAMRDARTIPEPRDYRSWRRNMLALEEAAARGDYEETWMLPGGRTHRVIGRPHSSGGLALMFEDISSEMTRLRNHRAEMELGQAVLDGIDDAVAVFSASGALLLSNTPYAALWGHDPLAVLDDRTLEELLPGWRARTVSDPFWDAVVAGATAPRQADLRLTDGRPLRASLQPLPGGSVMIRFQLRPAAKVALAAG
ncbi:PAS-domain containing protein [Falsirhodobacter algicola]|uniref:PAS domain-containing protein n=1 Tax=Falsirhodobacter algicola TaxID=2692330 RepID=A0A8J8MU26_9RHOB|nr:PAS-domain containing protein [Falsirhodobacter algicola]QUS36411.1 PAS domain-containing protein [Falsirhodobacter algicola]